MTKKSDRTAVSAQASVNATIGLARVLLKYHPEAIADIAALHQLALQGAKSQKQQEKDAAAQERKDVMLATARIYEAMLLQEKIAKAGRHSSNKLDVQ